MHYLFYVLNVNVNNNNNKLYVNPEIMNVLCKVCNNKCKKTFSLIYEDPKLPLPQKAHSYSLLW